MLTEATRNAQLNVLDSALYMSLHFQYSATGANELSGVSYARQLIPWLPAASGTKAISDMVTFGVDAGDTVAFFGLWDSLVAGTFMGMLPNSGLLAGQPLEFIAGYSDALTIIAMSNALAVSEAVTFWPDGTNNLPSGLSAGTQYFVINPTTDTFQVSIGILGTPITVNRGSGLYQRYAPQFIDATGTFGVSSIFVNLL